VDDRKKNVVKKDFFDSKDVGPVLMHAIRSVPQGRSLIPVLSEAGKVCVPKDIESHFVRNGSGCGFFRTASGITFLG